MTSCMAADDAVWEDEALVLRMTGSVVVAGFRRKVWI